MGYLEVKTLLDDAVARQIGSGMAAAFGNLKHYFDPSQNHEIYVGKTSLQGGALALSGEAHAIGQFSDPLSVTAISEKSYFDLASLTKILATTTLAMQQLAQGRLQLEVTVGEIAPEIANANSALGSLVVKDLLAHTSGLPAWKPFYETMRTHFGEKLPYVDLAARKKKFDELLYAVTPEAKAGEKIIYSDLGFLILENSLSEIAGRDFRTEVESMWRSMGILGLHFRPVFTDALTARFASQRKQESIAATEFCPWRGLLIGQVHDDNAWSRGGVAGHAGAFGRLSDVKKWMEAVFLGHFIAKPVLKKFTDEAVSVAGTRRALGFDLPSLDGTGSTGFWFSSDTVGHLGFTGTSLWLDLVTGDYAILLTNRVHPSRNDLRIRALRREFHRRVRSK